MTDEQKRVARQWCERNDCCLRLAAAIIRGGESLTTVTGCYRCPVAGLAQGLPRNQAAVNELGALLGVSTIAEAATVQA